MNRICLTCWLGPHCLVYWEIRASDFEQEAQPESHCELCFWAHGGNVAENVGTVIALVTFSCGIALVQFIWNANASSAHRSVSLPLCCHTEGVCCHLFHNKVKRFCSKLGKNGQYLTNCCTKRIIYSHISFLIQPFQWRSNPQNMVRLHMVIFVVRSTTEKTQRWIINKQLNEEHVGKLSIFTRSQ